MGFGSYGSLLRQFHLDSQSLRLGFTINLVSYSLTTKSRLPESNVILPIIHVGFFQSEGSSDYTQGTYVYKCTPNRLFWQGLHNFKRLVYCVCMGRTIYIICTVGLHGVFMS